MARAEREGRGLDKCGKLLTETRAQELVEKLLVRWNSYESRNATMSQRQASQHNLKNVRSTRAADLKHQKARVALEKVEIKRRKSEREFRWRSMNRKDITMAELL